MLRYIKILLKVKSLPIYVKYEIRHILLNVYRYGKYEYLLPSREDDVNDIKHQAIEFLKISRAKNYFESGYNIIEFRDGIVRYKFSKLTKDGKTLLNILNIELR